MNFESVIKKLDWSKMGTNVNGKFLSNLRFVDDIVLTPADLDQAQTMLRRLMKTQVKLVPTLMMTKLSKWKRRHRKDRQLHIHWSQIKIVVYKQTAEEKRIIGLGWVAFGKMNNNLKFN